MIYEPTKPACDCGSVSYSSSTTRYDGEEKHTQCNECGLQGNVACLPDVSYVPMPYYDEHLKCEVQDRHHKARLLKEKGWYEKRESKHPYISDPIARQKYFRDNIGE